MWLADKWNDYEVIDCSNGEKLERWGNYLLVRPDPQVIWDTVCLLYTSSTLLRKALRDPFRYCSQHLLLLIPVTS